MRYDTCEGLNRSNVGEITVDKVACGNCVIDYVSAKFTFNGVIDVESTSYLNSVSISATVNQFGTGTVQDNGVIASTTINNIITSAGCD